MAHFVVHGHHHFLPMDKLRCVTSPALTFALGTPFYKLTYLVFSYDWHAATAVFCGGVFGYIYYECLHFAMHYKV